jgi:proline-specific peptidase
MGWVLAQESILANPVGVKSLILSNSAASTKQWISEANRLRAGLPLEIQQVLKKHEDAGTTRDPAYAQATDVYYRRHLCRLDPWPDCLNRTLESLGQDPEVYNSMWGPSEFYCTGTLQDWDVENRIDRIGVPTLILSGRHDESTPAINQGLQHKIQNSEWVIFEESSHTPHLEETAAYLQVLSRFLARVEV